MAMTGMTAAAAGLAVAALDSRVGTSGSFKQRRSFPARSQDASTIRERYPDKIPVIIERYVYEKSLPTLDQNKFLVPSNLTMREFIVIIRRRLKVNRFKSFYLLANNQTLVSNCATLCEIYDHEKDADGFLYMVYASQETFGAGSATDV